ncbi:MarR family transcriptional regulator [Murinocardiopsis flavida]|uniref:MarR family transcriptional regulator n=1 Tax=Murinocardiopsis flavida TaxID=645275 RepID=A0A2P8DDS5_9ACTN|nr:MarR family transcriptional regulator [Murinocardiopsis flavida]PSK95383.1 MarR family transcriptional regulator [Murinocardiopsis flavida]
MPESTADHPASLLKLLVQAAHAVELRLLAELPPGLSATVRPAHLTVFRHLAADGSRITDLAEAAGMTQQSMGELVTHLQRQGLVERRTDPRDRRARLVVCTPEGRAVLDSAAAAIAAIEDAFAERSGRPALADLKRLLGDLVAETAPPPRATAGAPRTDA